MAFVAPLLPMLGTIGAGVSAVSTVVGGIAAGNAASYQAQVAENNAQVERQNATYATAAGTQAAEASSVKGAAQLGEIKTAQAASGIDVNTGSAVDVQAGQRGTNKLDTQNTLQNALLQGYGYRVQAQADESQAALDQATAEEAPIGAALGATGTLLSNASSLSTKWGAGSTTPTPGSTSWAYDTKQA